MDERHYSFAACFSLANLMAASTECYKGVRWKGQPTLFMNNKLTNCAQLYRELQSETYRPRPVIKFRIIERGKPREIKPVNFRDRVVQRCLCDNILTPVIIDRIIEDNSACLKGRGLSYAYDRVRYHVLRCPMDGWVLQYDFSGYFGSINQERLLSMLREMIPDAKVMRLVETIIHDDDGGLELGSHVSQLCAALYPTVLDEAIESVRGVVGYHRYMDDGIAICANKEAAIKARETLYEYCNLLGLKLNRKKTHINRVTTPFCFCKMRYTKTEYGVRLNVPKKQTRRSINHNKDVHRLAKTHPECDIDLLPVDAAFHGYINRGDADLTWITRKGDMHATL